MVIIWSCGGLWWFPPVVNPSVSFTLTFSLSVSGPIQAPHTMSWYVCRTFLSTTDTDNVCTMIMSSGPLVFTCLDMFIHVVTFTWTQSHLSMWRFKSKTGPVKVICLHPDVPALRRISSGVCQRLHRTPWLCVCALVSVFISVGEELVACLIRRQMCYKIPLT